MPFGPKAQMAACAVPYLHVCKKAMQRLADDVEILGAKLRCGIVRNYVRTYRARFVHNWGEICPHAHTLRVFPLQSYFQRTNIMGNK